ncbi:MAG: hypothetical protein KF774_02405 [Planctomyces sp.]|nr:hypothetical protein [Planctomyces sp.]
MSQKVLIRESNETLLGGPPPARPAVRPGIGTAVRNLRRTIESRFRAGGKLTAVESKNLASCLELAASKLRREASAKPVASVVESQAKPASRPAVPGASARSKPKPAKHELTDAEIAKLFR